MKRILSSILIVLLSCNTLFVNAIDITFENLDSDSIYIENLENEDETFSDLMEFNSSMAITNTINNDNTTKQIVPKNFNTKNAISMNNVNTITPTDLSYTTIDLTDLATGEVITHDCNLYLTTNFDETNHWSECSVCGKVMGLESHNYIDNGWTGGNANICNESNVHQFVCNCGASYSTIEGRTAHTWKYSSSDVAYIYVQTCSVCQQQYHIHECIKSDGSRISCTNPGRCTLCGYNYSAYHVGRVYYGLYDENTYLPDEPKDVYCDTCSKYLGRVEDIVTTYDSDGVLTLYNQLFINGTYKSLTTNVTCNNGTSTVTSKNINGLTHTAKIKFNAHYEFNTSIIHAYNYQINGIKHRIAVWRYPYPERTAPVISNIVTNNNENDWNTNSKIIMNGTENYCNSVYITLKDINDNIYLENINIPVNNGNWNYEIAPNIETKENTEFILTVKDTLNNETTQSFYLTKTDIKAPSFVGDKETSTEWSKTKNYVVTTIDSGIGQVSNAINNTENYEQAIENDNIFYKGYIFTGDVYGSIPIAVYSKDGLNNVSTEFVTVYNLDNTSPTIEKVVLNKTLHSTNVIIQANDINTKLNAEGSGVTGYAITNENIEPTEYQESNSFTITEPNTYYVWIKDLVGNVISKEFDIPVQYKVTINPDGGIWKGSTESQEIIISSDEPYDLTPIPEKEGYTFTEWRISGEGYITNNGELIVTGSDVEVIPIWETNQYSVTYIDYDLTHNQTLTEITKQVNFDTIIRGFDLGNDTSDNVYYNQYRLVSDTESKVLTSNNTVYRYFEFCHTNKSSHIDFNDNDNIDNLRPETYTLQLQLEDGTLVNEVTLSSDVTDYTFEKLPKYDENGTEYKYQIIPVISDRYKVTPNPETGEPEITYSNPEYSILIPKITTLNGKTGDLNYTLKVNSTLFYDDKIIVTPDNNFLLTDGINTLSANIVQNQTTFTKEDITNNQLTVTGDIQVNKKYFAGTWIGVFNFNIKYIPKN